MRAANALCEAFSNEGIEGNFGWTLMAPPHQGRLRDREGEGRRKTQRIKGEGSRGGVGIEGEEGGGAIRVKYVLSPLSMETWNMMTQGVISLVI